MSEKFPEDQRPQWLINAQVEGTGLGTMSVDDKTYSYTLVRPGLAPGLPYTVGYPSEGVLFISIDVPEEERSLILAHEIREKNELNHLHEDERCHAALIAELAEARTALSGKYDSYLKRRRDFFAALLEFYNNPEQSAAVSPQFKESLKKSADYLHRVTANPNT